MLTAMCILLILQQFIHLLAHVNSYISYPLAYATKEFVPDLVTIYHRQIVYYNIKCFMY